MDRFSKAIFSITGSKGKNQETVTVSWSFVALLLGLVFAVMLVCAGFFWYFSFGFKAKPAQSLALTSISAPATIRWNGKGATAIESDDLTASVAALGYVHATHKPWQMVLWRQTAMGALSGWFGPSLLELDRLNKQLRFASLSESTFEALPQEKQELLEAYAEGVNQAINQQSLLSHNDFAFLGADIRPWEAWHTLAVERLFAWLATDSFVADSALTQAEQTTLQSLIKSDNALHQFLQMYDFQYSFAGTWKTNDLQDSDYFYHRLVYGASAHSIVQEVRLDRAGQAPMLVASIPGTLTFISLISEDLRWAMLPSSRASFELRTADTKPTVSHERITNRDGTEILATFNHYPNLIALNPEAADSSQALHWTGLSEGTDAFAFLDLLNGEISDFELLDGKGYLQSNPGDDRILGDPEYVFQLAQGTLISTLPWSFYVANHIDSLSIKLPDLANPKQWNNHCYNPWAAERAPLLFAGLNATSLEAPIYQDAITYLRNWDYGYAPSSIGAAIFERWLVQLDIDDVSSRLDTTWQLDPVRLTTSFKASVDSLNVNFGDDLSQWRLEQTQPVKRYFPAWAADSLYSADETLLSETNYAPLYFPGKGDVATLCSGSFESDEHGPISAQWEGWHTIKNNKSVTYWRKHVTPSTFLERYLISNRPNLEVRLDADDNDAKTTTIQPRL